MMGRSSGTGKPIVCGEQVASGCGRICSPASGLPGPEARRLSKESRMNRRHFLMSTAVMAGNAAVRGMQSPNDTIRVGIAGLGGRGGSHVSGWAGMKNVEIAGLCDVDESHIGDKAKAIESRGLRRPTVYTDFRQMLESKDIDAVSI